MLYYERILGQLDYQIEEAILKRDLWLKVEHHTKKDGSEYVSPKKALTNCTLKTEYPLYSVYQPCLEVYGYTRNNKRVEDSIYCYCHKGDLTGMYDDKEFVKYNEWFRPVYTFTYDDIMKAIERRIAYYNRKIERMQREKDKCELVVSTINAKCEDLWCEIAKLQENDNELYYIIREHVKKEF